MSVEPYLGEDIGKKIAVCYSCKISNFLFLEYPRGRRYMPM